jgi:serine/threonine protein kinase
LAPELWKNESCSKQSDIWALGVMLYELCCHAYPFPATEEAELEHKVLYTKMGKIPHSVNLEFQDFITKMLKKEQKERPSIEEIIYNDVFQTKAILQKVTLPLVLNK